MVRTGFAAKPWAWLLTAAGVALFSTLGVWQVHRGLAKQQMLSELAAPSAAAENLSAASVAPEGLNLRRARARGKYLPERQLLEDGQSHRQQPGYHVWTPLQLEDGAIVLVDRGWVPRDAAAVQAPAPAGEMTLQGFWRALPEPGLRLAAAGDCPAEKKFPAVVLYPAIAQVRCLLGASVLPGLFLLDAAEPGGFVREWTDLGFPPERHFGYAFQWFVLAIAAIVIFFRVNRKPSP